MKSERLILGIAASAQGAAALVGPQGVLAAVEEERLSRIKGDSSFPFLAIEAVLKQAGVTPDDLAGVVVGDEGKDLPAIWARNLLCRRMDRQEALLAAAIAAAPFTPEAALVLDSAAPLAGTGLYRIEGNQPQCLCKTLFPQSVDLVYGAVTQLLGYEAGPDAYKVMGLAAYGKPHADLRARLENMMTVASEGYAVDLSFFDRDSCGDPKRPWFNAKGRALLDGGLVKDGVFTSKAMDLAFEAQRLLEKALIGQLKILVSLTRARKIVVTGGVALNGRALNALRTSGVVADLYVPLAPYDAGAAVGAALAAQHRLGTSFGQGSVYQSPFLGPCFSDAVLGQALAKAGVPCTRPNDLEDEVAAEIEKGHVVGWFQGRMEFGARALGARSILADPRFIESRERVNLSVKNREDYRPLAPSVLEEEAERYFAGGATPFMNIVVAAKPLAREMAPAVVHVDGTARPQSVPKDWPSPAYRRLLERFYQRTGVPMLLNTSFNVAGEPIVCTPDDAVRCFAQAGLDALALGPFLVRKRG